ncbi:hypothetical protein PR001_g12063 [Phytophthora rubi]|nr:hypothetical protein PR001_g12063 [Phytophthora rubi]KAE9032968.1 hypothetical protein PR002_g8915 [Phytophthora rubi]
MTITYAPTNENLADLFTKSLGPFRFEQLRDQLCIEDTDTAWVDVGSGVAAGGGHRADDVASGVVVEANDAAMHS